jgi:glycosyltransferase involved in cell wall biosynthesis
MGDTLFISICIPAYQRTEYLKRLLDSIEMQTFRRFEVVITDDSPGREVQELVENHPLNGEIRYFKNPKTLGTPENWNEGMRKAATDWIKIMHDDDWFSGPDSLRIFADAIEKGNAGFYFSAFSNVFPDGHSETIKIKAARLKMLKKLPEVLIAANRVGPPSAVIFKKDDVIRFDNRMQWLVDFDFYIRYLKKHPPAEYIPRALVQVGISDSQVTRSSYGRPEIEIPERFMLAEKLDRETIRHIPVFDSWWRFLRNLSIRDITQIEKSGYKGKIPDFIPPMIKRQNMIPRILLKWGLFSKLFMFIYFLKTRKRRFLNG